MHGTWVATSAAYNVMTTYISSCCKLHHVQPTEDKKIELTKFKSKLQSMHVWSALVGVVATRQDNCMCTGIKSTRALQSLSNYMPVRYIGSVYATFCGMWNGICNFLWVYNCYSRNKGEVELLLWLADLPTGFDNSHLSFLLCLFFSIWRIHTPRLCT